MPQRSTSPFTVLREAARPPEYGVMRDAGRCARCWGDMREWRKRYMVTASGAGDHHTGPRRASCLARIMTGSYWIHVVAVVGMKESYRL